MGRARLAAGCDACGRRELAGLSDPAVPDVTPLVTPRGVRLEPAIWFRTTQEGEELHPEWPRYRTSGRDSLSMDGQRQEVIVLESAEPS